MRQKKRVPGYGHKILKDGDHRALLLLSEARRLKLAGKYSDFAEGVDEELKTILPGKKLPLNIDGAIASVALDLGFDWREVTGLFIIGRLPGLIAHIKEEKEQNND